MEPSGHLPRKTRARKACDFCHRRGRRCRLLDETSLRCSTCAAQGISCSWTRVPSKRGAKPRSAHLQKWTLKNMHGSRNVIGSLIDHFFESAYPIAITLHEETFRNEWNSGAMPSGRASYARLMAMCSLSLYRIKNGAFLVPRSVPEALDGDFFLKEALESIPDRVEEIQDFKILQAIGLVCLTALQCNKFSLLHQYLGLYHAVLAVQGFCDERRWPRGISEIDTEERRRLFWHMYRLEVHTALVSGHAIRCPELQSFVSYPSIPNNDFEDSAEDSEWLTGWNFVTDLYRGIEHITTHIKCGRGNSSADSRCLTTSFCLDYDPREKILLPLALSRMMLPRRFKIAESVSADICRNRCGFQAANIACTYQLLRMVSFTADQATIHEACWTVLELIEEISAIPIDYLRATSLAMLQEISGLGHILSSFIKKDLPHSDYQDLRAVMLCMSELLESLSSCMADAVHASKRLRAYVKEIDYYLEKSGGSSVTLNGSQEKHSKTLQAPPESLDSMVPLEILQRIPWPMDLIESIGLI